MRVSDPVAPFGSQASVRFGSFELQLLERRLLVAGTATGLGPRGFDVLALLVARAGHLVSKAELFACVWPKVVVDDSALQFQISALRKIVGAAAIATVSGRGYRFMLPVLRSDGAGADREERAMHNLRQAPTRCVGRENDLAQLKTLLDRARLVTLTGAGGCGKTRLAIEKAARLVQRHADGIWIVELATLADGAQLPQALMSVLGTAQQASGTPLDALIAHLGGKRLLLLLDNAEHLLAACSDLIDRLLHGCPGVSVLVTSRQALGVVGELTYHVPSLSVPDPQQRWGPEALLAHASVQLFTERARLLRPHFTVTPQNAPALALLCWRLAGIPLAIELAAGRMRAMPLEALSQRLNQRFDLLSEDAHSALPRHRTLRAVLDWSYELLNADEQALLSRLSVFAGSCTLEAAEQVCSDEGADSAGVLDGLAALADRNLLAIDEQGGVTRYRMLETVRQYASEQLQRAGDASVWRDRHLHHFTQAMQHGQACSHGADRDEGWGRVEIDNDNLRVALAWARSRGQTGVGALAFAGDLAAF